MSSSNPLNNPTTALYQKDGTLYTHTSPITSLQPLSNLPPDLHPLFKPPPDAPTPYILTTPSTIFHAQGGGQPSDTGTIRTPSGATFTVHQVRRVEPAILHMGTLESSSSSVNLEGEDGTQSIDVEKRVLHSRLHTAGHILGTAIALLVASSSLPPDIIDGKASHYPGAAFVECIGLIPGTAKPLIQAKVDELVAADLPITIEYWSEERARKECTGVLESFKGGEEGVRVVKIGDEGSYPCGGTHVGRTGECGRVVVRNIKRQKGISKIGYEVMDV